MMIAKFPDGREHFDHNPDHTHAYQVKQGSGTATFETFGFARSRDEAWELAIAHLNRTLGETKVTIVPATRQA